MNTVKQKSLKETVLYVELLQNEASLNSEHSYHDDLKTFFKQRRQILDQIKTDQLVANIADE